MKAARNDIADILLIASLRSIGRQIIAQSQSDWTSDEEPALFYRLTYITSPLFFDDDIGFMCDRWLEECDFKKPSIMDAGFHINKKVADWDSSFISLSDRPGRALNFGNKRRYSCGGEMVVIDASRLRTAKVNLRRTTEWARMCLPCFGGQVNHNASESHWLAWPCIPACCIVKRFPLSEFWKVCLRNEISGSE